MSGFDNRSDLPPPHYDWSQHDFDSKTATAAERSLHQSFAPISGPSRSAEEDDYEAWSDAKFEAAARAFEARQAKRRMQGIPQPGASGSGPGLAPNRASSSGAQHDVSGPQTYQSDRSQTPRPSNYAHPYYSLAPASAPTSAPASAPAHAPMAPPQTPIPPYVQGPPPSNVLSNEDGLAVGSGGLQRAVSLFRTPSMSQHDDDGEQLPAFTDVARPEEMVPQDMAQTGPTSPPTVSQSPPPPHTFSAPPTIPQSPPPPHTFSPPSNPPPPSHNVRAQTGPAFLAPTAPQSPPPPHTFSAPSSPSPALRNVQSPPPPSNVSRPRPVSHASAPASPIHNDPPPAFIPSNFHYPIPEKTNPPPHVPLGNTRGMSSPMSVYASAKRTTTYASPTINFDLDAAYGRTASPGLPKETAGSFYSSAVSSTMSGRQLPKPGGARPRASIPTPPEPSPWATSMGGQPGTYGGLDQTSPYAQYQQPYQTGGFYAQPLAQQPSYGQNQPPQQGTHWNNPYPNYGLTTPPPGGHGQPAGWGTPATQWPGNGSHYRP